MKITKTDENVVYTRTTVDHTFIVNGKEILVRQYKTSECDEFDEPTIEEGYDNLTDTELEEVEENIQDLLLLEVDEIYKPE